jgi:hypothetical protein
VLRLILLIFDSEYLVWRASRAVAGVLSVLVSATSLVAMATLVVMATSARAAVVVDQSYTGPAGSYLISLDNWSSAQTFVAGVSGGMTAIDLWGTGRGALDIEVRTTDSSGAPSSTALATGTGPA